MTREKSWKRVSYIETWWFLKPGIDSWWAVFLTIHCGLALITAPLILSLLLCCTSYFSLCKFAMQTLRSRSEDWLMKAVQIIPWFPRYFAHKCCSFILPCLSWFCFCCLLVAHLTASFLLCYCPSSSAFISYDTGWCEMFTHGALGLQFSCNMLMQSQFIIPISVFAVWLGSRCSMGV